MEMIVPWTTTVSVGVLKSGHYKVQVQKSLRATKGFGSFPVAVSTSKSIDDHFYAYVTNVMVRENANREASVTISGSYSMDCIYLKDVMVVKHKADVINVLPIVDTHKDKACAHLFVPVPFHKTIHLKKALTEKATLFHVRSMNGQSLNYVTE